MMPRYSGRRWLGAFAALASCWAAGVHSFTIGRAAPSRIRVHASSTGGAEEAEPEPETPPEAAISPAAVTMDDGGSDLTDRFKYKVHALMGDYDPPSGTVDDENQTGNIMGSLLQFPTEYAFSVVGRTGGDAGDEYAEEVKQALVSVLGSEAQMELRSVPRGTKFTRVSVKVEVESAGMITTIYDALDALESTVMKF